MRVAIVYESLMGNTRQVAEAIADGVREAVPGADVVCASADQTGTVEADLLIVGAPAHFFGLPRPGTRRMWINGQEGAQRRGDRPVTSNPTRPVQACGSGSTPSNPPPPTQSVAVLDTRLDRPSSGGAAPRIARRRQRLRYRLAAAREGFLVEDMGGPVRAVEGERARHWGADLAQQPAAEVPG